MDILEIGNGGLTAAEERTMMAIWCVSKSPLLLGNDLSKMTAATLAVVGNEQLIGVNQDALGVAAARVSSSPAAQVWAGALAGGAGGGSANVMVLALLNTGDQAATLSADWGLIGLPPNARANATDLWDPRAAAQTFVGSATASVAPHDTAVFRLVW